MKTRLGLLLVLPLLFPATGVAQDAELEEQAAEAHAQYAELWSAGDVDGLLGMFADDAIMWPLSGGQHEGTDEIRQGFEAGPTPTEARIEGTHLERMNGVIVDVGTFTITMPPEAGGEEMQGEYIALLAEDADGLAIQRLLGFPMRQPPPAGE